MVTRRDVRRLLDAGWDYDEIGRSLGVPAGQAYMLATGLPADGSGTPPPGEEPPGYRHSAQRLVHPPAHNPTSRPSVHRWIVDRAAEQRGGAAGPA